MWYSEGWRDYELLDASDGERLERWGKYILVRPDPQVIWKGLRRHKMWDSPDAVYRRSSEGGGRWEIKNLPESWQISYRDMNFIVHPTSFKHTGLFPEQAANWDWMDGAIRQSGRSDIKVLNLFAYTGGATVAAAKAGASVCHVDAAKGMVAQARRNAELSSLSNAPIRYITDDCRKFIEREIKRGNRYDAVIMDPPSYGRGPSGELWKIEDCVYDLISLAVKVLSEKPLFFLINSYTTGLSPSVMSYMLGSLMTITSSRRGQITSDELGLKVSCGGGLLPCGAAARWIAARLPAK